ncbi:hypothetical protein DFJ58DRAFT_839436 [Suillus subalutaceus]|uniref:uncharacterized protein n=1 Tax=Suillus subalutaceus TaxID=48586 RepID=UPI001B865D14|nr:uncharacterized protein DFJ58DRAFT_839436 [Suillus subalutaceus]KAG1862588.1 hypothetical protein DFJ58DRAFT_839436 [Suillus subalutaceus]
MRLLDTTRREDSRVGWKDIDTGSSDCTSIHMTSQGDGACIRFEELEVDHLLVALSIQAAYITQLCPEDALVTVGERVISWLATRRKPKAKVEIEIEIPYRETKEINIFVLSCTRTASSDLCVSSIGTNPAARVPLGLVPVVSAYPERQAAGISMEYSIRILEGAPKRLMSSEHNRILPWSHIGQEDKIGNWSAVMEGQVMCMVDDQFLKHGLASSQKLCHPKSQGTEDVLVINSSIYNHYFCLFM